MPVEPVPKEFHAKKTAIVGGVVLTFFLFTYTRDLQVPDHPSIFGHTMGTTYEVRLIGFNGKHSNLLALKTSIDEKLQTINQQMSTYLLESEISRFNRHTSPTPYKVSSDFATVTRNALALSKESDGAFDPTLDPLIKLWGFGSSDNPTTEPSLDQIEELREQCGTRFLNVKQQYLEKSHPKLQLNLGAIAKGFAVDKIAKMLDDRKYTCYYVEIGGEVRVKGSNQDGVPWRIGIDHPSYGAQPGKDPWVIVQLRNKAIATSGDYRNFFTGDDGLMYSHVFDPRTGRPLTNEVASVSVIANSCMLADGMATALMVMGPKEGLIWVNKKPSVEALFVLRGRDGSYQETVSSGFSTYVMP